MINNYKLKTKLKQLAPVRKIYGQAKNTYRETKQLSFNRSELKYFIVLTIHRSGSTCLLDMLDLHPKVSADPYSFFDYNNLPVDFGAKKFTFSRKSTRGYKFFTQPIGYENTIDNIHIAQEELNKLADLGVKIIYLQRKNLLQRSISHFIARNKLLAKEYNVNFHKKDWKNLKLDSSVEIDIDELYDDLRKCEKQEQFNQEVVKKIPCLRLTYEEDLLNEEEHQKTFNKVCNFLDLEQASCITRYAKITSSNIRDTISNYDVLEAEFRDTCYEQYL